MDDLIQEKVTQKENELNATYDEKMRNYEERCVYSILVVRGSSCISLVSRTSNASLP